MITPEQQQQIQSQLKSSGIAPAAGSPAWYQQLKATNPSVDQQNEPQTPSYAADLADQLRGGGDTMTNSVETAANRVAADNQQPATLGNEFAKAGHLVEGGLGAAAGAAQTLFSPLSALFQKAADTTGIHPFDAAMSTPEGKAFAAWAQQHPEAATNLQNTLTVASSEGGAEGAGAAAPIVKDAAGDAAGSLKASLAPTELTPEMKAAKDAAAQDAAHQQAAGAIEKEVRNTAAKYPSVGKLLNQSEVAKGNDPISVLSSYENGQALPALKDGKLQVDDATGFLKDQVGRLSDIKDNLVSSSKDVTPVADFQARSNAIIDSQKGWSLAKKEATKADVQKLTEPWNATYPDGIPNPELDALKTEHANESTSYNSKSPFSLDAHAVVAKAARQLVQNNAADAPIDELNKLIASHYDAIKLLGAMRGKTPHGGALSKMFNNTVGEIGGMAGGLALGHPFLGAMAGRAGAEAVNNIINNHFISNPLKRTLVNNMKGADPEVVQKALDYLEPNTQPEVSTPPAQLQNPELPE